MKKIIISGSTAYDYIMDFNKNFSESIGNSNSKDPSKLNFSFQVQKLKKENGGTGSNICYNLALLQQNALLVSSIGDDFTFKGLIKERINLDNVYKNEHEHTASAHIINDAEGNQIDAFYPGAMEDADKISLKGITDNVGWIVIAPNKKQAMIQHIEEAYEHHDTLKIIFNPGQQVTVFSGEELISCLEKSDYLICNQYEYEELLEKINKPDVLSSVEKAIITLGENGCKILGNHDDILISAVKTKDFIDPTGAGDAFIAGVLKGLARGTTLETACRIGSICAHHCVEFHGSQNHFLNKSLVEESMMTYFREEISLY
ncbi:PfkB family carbohydrate kinase [Candidatus Gracilibacteria bacterium]|nr:PfkB family carbohydrate kinase [Candidatus Gracilibacteria bacterium]